MALYGWHNCPIAVRAQVERLSFQLSRALGEQLVGLYLHGSLAMNCFNPAHSDLDLLAIVGMPMSPTTKRQIVEGLLACSQQPHPVEISLLARGQLLPWRYPTPFDLHYSEMWRAAYTHDLAARTWRTWNDEQQCDPDLAGHITVLNARGICLMGAPIAAIFPPVPAGDFRASLAGDLHDSLAAIAANPVYTILNCCRTYAYVSDRRVLSKEEGGRWALSVFPTAFRAPVATALAAYRSDTPGQRFDAGALSDFVDYMRQVLTPVLEHQAPG